MLASLWGRAVHHYPESSLIRPRAGEKELRSRMFGTHSRHHAGERRGRVHLVQKKVRSKVHSFVFNEAKAKFDHR